MTETALPGGNARAYLQHVAQTRARLLNPTVRKRVNDTMPEPEPRSEPVKTFLPRTIHEAELIAPDPLPVRDIIDGVCAFYPVSAIDILSDRHTAKLVRPRHIAMYLARTMTPRSLPYLGRCFRRDHTSIKSAVDRMTARLANDKNLAEHVAAIRKHIEARTGVGVPANDNRRMAH